MAGDGPGDAEQPEVVVVSGAGQPQEGTVETWFAGDEFHAEHLGVEAHRAVEVGDEEHRVVETDGRDGHRLGSPHWAVPGGRARSSFIVATTITVTDDGCSYNCVTEWCALVSKD